MHLKLRKGVNSYLAYVTCHAPTVGQKASPRNPLQVPIIVTVSTWTLVGKRLGFFQLPGTTRGRRSQVDPYSLVGGEDKPGTE